VEAHLADRGGTAGEHLVEQAPAVQLDHPAAGQRMGREGVARQQGSVDHDDVVAHPSQQQGQGTAAGPAADYGDVVLRVGRAHRFAPVVVGASLASTTTLNEPRSPTLETT
jgi:hypothetical protein